MEFLGLVIFGTVRRSWVRESAHLEPWTTNRTDVISSDGRNAWGVFFPPRRQVSSLPLIKATLFLPKHCLAQDY